MATPGPDDPGRWTGSSPVPQRRLFIAVPVPSQVRAAIAAVVGSAQAHREARRAVRWVSTDGLHLTLRFLGATPPGRVNAAADAVREAAALAGPFAIALAGAGAFPRDDRPRALWLGVSAGASELGSLAAAVDAALVHQGWAAEPRSFRAHLTLARSEDPAEGRAALVALRDAVAAAEPDLRRAWRPDEVILYESHLGRGPARYEVVAAGRIGG